MYLLNEFYCLVFEFCIERVFFFLVRCLWWIFRCFVLFGYFCLVFIFGWCYVDYSGCFNFNRYSDLIKVVWLLIYWCLIVRLFYKKMNEVIWFLILIVYWLIVFLILFFSYLLLIKFIYLRLLNFLIFMLVFLINSRYCLLIGNMWWKNCVLFNLVIFV